MQVCKRCVVNDKVPGAIFDANGYCNFCSTFIKNNAHIITNDPVLQKQELDEIIRKVKRNGQGKKYDCIVGVSGGIDSSWVLVQVKKLGLRPLAVHMDN